MRKIVSILGAAGLAACASTAEPELTGDTPTDGPSATRSGALQLGGGYRGGDDPCRRAGVNALTAPFANRENDLVACPVDFDGRPAFIQATVAREVTRTEDYVVYSVPLFGAAPVTQVPPTPPITGG